jgi:hypothetical protein
MNSLDITAQLNFSCNNASQGGGMAITNLNNTIINFN